MLARLRGCDVFMEEEILKKQIIVNKYNKVVINKNLIEDYNILNK